MRALTIFLLLIAVSLVISALVSYPLYLLLQDLVQDRPQKLINAMGKLLLIPGFILVIRHYGIANKQHLGYGLPKKLFLKELLQGWLVGLLILGLLSAVLILMEVRLLAELTDDLPLIIVNAALTGLIGGLLIGFIEETFFRGGLFGCIRKEQGFLLTLILSSLLYAAAHFISPPPLPEGDVMGWFSGLVMIGGAFEELNRWQTYNSFLALFMVGAFLSIVRERTGNIAYCIGLHAGWVFVIKVTKNITVLDYYGPNLYLVGEYDGITGHLASGWLLCLCLFFLFFWRKKGLPTAANL